MKKYSKVRDLNQSARNVLETELMQAALKGLINGASSQVTDTQTNENKDYRSALLHMILDVFSSVLKLSREKIDSREKMSTYGVDSIVITGIVGRIAEILEVSISAAIFYEARCIEDLADIIADRFGKQVCAHFALSTPLIVAPATPPTKVGEAAKTTFQALIAKSRAHSKKRSELPKPTPAHGIDEPVHHTSKHISDKNRANIRKPLSQPGASNKKSNKPSIPNMSETTPSAAYEPIAIIGMDGMFAQSSNLDELQRNLYQGKDCISEIPKERWNWESIYGNPKDGALTNVKYAGFIPEVDKFDPAFFGISPREARVMDPQHRLFLECTWRLIESSGYAPSALAGKKVGVFVGINLQDYAEMVLATQERDVVEVTGIPHMFCPNRISYLLDLKGPSEVIDTACSSSLVAIHRAAMSIQYNACDMAIAGGSNLILSPKVHILFSKAEMISKDGRSKAFSKNANGYARGEGVGAVLLKKLKDAEADKDNILGVIIGSAENHGGAATSLMAPNPKAQAELINDAHRKANLDPRSISYIECHGTGTVLGDPIEINALKMAFAEMYRAKDVNETPQQHCALGSIKSNIGHAEVAAGVAGVIKVLLAMRDEYLPASLHCEELNPHIQLDDSPFYVLQQGHTWQRPSVNGQIQPFNAGVSSFGAGGSNAHLVVQEYQGLHAPEEALDDIADIFVLSAKDDDRLGAYAALILNFVKENKTFVASHFKQFLYTLQVARDGMESRAAFVAQDPDQLITKLQFVAERKVHSGVYVAHSSTGSGTANLVNTQDIERCWVACEWQELARMWVEARNLDWKQRYGEQTFQRLSLPGYPFNKQKYWIELAPQVVNHQTKRIAIETTVQEVKPLSLITPLNTVNGTSRANGKITLTPLNSETNKELHQKVTPTHRNAEFRGSQSKANGHVTGADSLDKIMEALSQSLMQALCIEANKINPDSNFVDLGLDSIVGAEWVHVINNQLGTKLSATRLYDYPNIRQLAQFIMLNQAQPLEEKQTPHIVNQAVLTRKRTLESPDVIQNAMLHPSAQSTITVNEIEIQEALKKSLADALCTEVDALDVTRSFAELGLDSIIGAEWVHKINGMLGTELSATRLYDYSSIELLAQHITTAGHTSERVNPAVKSSPMLNEQTPKEATPKEQTSGDFVHLESLLLDSLAEVLCTEVDSLWVTRPFSELGLDSIIGAEWVHKINGMLGTELSATRLYDYPNVSALAQYVDGERIVNMCSKPLAAPQANSLYERKEEHGNPTVSPAELTPDIPVRTKPSYEPIGSIKQTYPSHAVAIVGISGRYPDAQNLDQYWDNLVLGRNSVREVPKGRWDTDAYFDTDARKEGKVYCKWLGALSDIANFDPLFFGISPGEAEDMDPQHRLFIQEGYKAFEDAGYSPETLSSTKCGVYMGIMSSEYSHMMHTSAASMSGTGNSFAIGAARIPYFLNLKGPAIPIDTACSSSLVATHLAFQALNNGEVDMALVGGVSLYLMPETYIGMCAAGMLSPDGLCKTFDNSANGFVPGEGAGAMVLKRLSHAESDGDPIHGVIIGSGINQDGKTNGITAPSTNSQIELEREVYQKHGIAPDSISYVEAHGTGTKLGDPIELDALKSVFSENTQAKNFCGIGSVKSNIGHTSAASGVASIQKVLLSMKHGQLVPSLHFNTPNQHFNFDDSPFYVNTVLKSWQSKAPRRAAVSSFGYSGTNAHLVIEEYQAPSLVHKDGSVLVVLSAARADRLPLMAQNLLSWVDKQQGLNGDKSINLNALAYTLQTGRRMMEERLAFVVDSVNGLKTALNSVVNEATGADTFFRNRVNVNDQSDKTALQYLARDADFGASLVEWAQQKNLSLLAKFWVTGVTIDWEQLYVEAKPRRISLPTYPFVELRCWFEEKPIAVEERVFQPTSQAAPQTTPTLPVVCSQRDVNWLKTKENWVKTELDDGLSWTDRLRAKKDQQILVISESESDYRALENVSCEIEQLADIDTPIWTLEYIALTADAQKLKSQLQMALSNGPVAVFLILPQRDDAEDLSLTYSCVKTVQGLTRLNQLKFYVCHKADYRQLLTSSEVSYEALSGLLRSAVVESVDHSYRTLITDPGMNSNETAIKWLQEYLYEASGSLEKNALALHCSSVRISGEERFELNMTESDMTESEALSQQMPSFRQGGTYLMVGALGRVGEQVCQILGRDYHAQLIIFSRRSESKAEDVLARIRASGAEVIYVVVDVLDTAALAYAMKSVKAQGITINGVVHMARQVSDGSIQNKPWNEFQQMIAPKAKGTMNIDAATVDEPLECFLLFSSMSSLGIQGSPDYAYSAAFQNAFARYRQHMVQLGQRSGQTVSLCWGQWEIDGAVAQENLPLRLARLAEQGMDSINAESAVRVIQQGKLDTVTGLVAITDLDKVRQLIGLEKTKTVIAENLNGSLDGNLNKKGPDHYFSRDEVTRAIAQFKQGNTSQVEFAAYLSTLSLPHLPVPLQQEITDVINGSESKPATNPALKPSLNLQDDKARIRDGLDWGIQKVMKLGTNLDWNKQLQDYGMDSIIAMQLSTTLEKHLQIPLQPSWLIEYPTANLLMEKLNQQVQPQVHTEGSL